MAALEARKAELQDQLVEATDEKNRAARRQGGGTAKRLNLAERLVNGLKDENERWGTTSASSTSSASCWWAT